MIDVRGLADPDALAAADFAFRVAAPTGADPGQWAAAPAPASVSVRRGAGAGGSDRVTITWADNAIRNQWLQVTLKGNGHTGLAADDVFSFANLIGETGDGTTLRVTALDLAAVKRALNTTSDVTGRFDFNRDGRVNALDIAALKQNLNRSLGTPAALAPAMTAGAAPLPARRTWDESAPDLLA
jgi:hypothetical protein